MMVVMATAANRGSEIVYVGELSAAGSAGEIGSKLAKLIRLGGVSILLSRLGGGLQVCGNLLCYFRVLCGVRLLQLLQSRE